MRAAAPGPTQVAETPVQPDPTLAEVHQLRAQFERDQQADLSAFLKGLRNEVGLEMSVGVHFIQLDQRHIEVTFLGRPTLTSGSIGVSIAAVGGPSTDPLFSASDSLTTESVLLFCLVKSYSRASSTLSNGTIGVGCVDAAPSDSSSAWVSAPPKMWELALWLP